METDRRKNVDKIIALLKEAHPDAKLALEFSNPLELLVALILAAQAPDERVNTVTASLFKKYKTPADWAAAEPETLQKELSSIPFYRNKSRSIQNACRELLEKFAGKVPGNLDDLLTLPGVGRKTANIVLGNAFGKPAIGVDRHVARVAGRLGLSNNTDPDKIEADLVPIIPPEEQVHFCHLLQYHGRRICASKTPKCPQCTISPFCAFQNKSK